MENVQNTVNLCSTPELRPCWVDGKRALFHRWADSARPVTGKGAPDTVDQPRYQLWNVHGIVEFEDGTLDRVWVYRIQFAPTPRFKDYDWEYMERERDEITGTYTDPVLPAVLEIEKALEREYGDLNAAAPANIVGITYEPSLLEQFWMGLQAVMRLPFDLVSLAGSWLWGATFGREKEARHG